MLQVLLHTALQTLQEPDGTVSADTLLSKCQTSTADLCPIHSFFLANMSCSLVEGTLRRPQVYRSLIQPALASLQVRFLFDLHMRFPLEAHFSDATQHAELDGVKSLAVVNDTDFCVDHHQHEVAQVVDVSITAG